MVTDDFFDNWESCEETDSEDDDRYMGQPEWYSVDATSPDIEQEEDLERNKEDLLTTNEKDTYARVKGLKQEVNVKDPEVGYMCLSTNVKLHGGNEIPKDGVVHLRTLLVSASLLAATGRLDYGSTVVASYLLGSSMIVLYPITSSASKGYFVARSIPKENM